MFPTKKKFFLLWLILLRTILNFTHCVTSISPANLTIISNIYCLQHLYFYNNFFWAFSVSDFFSFVVVYFYFSLFLWNCLQMYVGMNILKFSLYFLVHLIHNHTFLHTYAVPKCWSVADFLGVREGVYKNLLPPVGFLLVWSLFFSEYYEYYKQH